MKFDGLTVRPMAADDVAKVVDLQRACFPAPFPEALLWRPEHLLRHLGLFPDGQFVVVAGDEVVASASALRTSEDAWEARGDWKTATGGFFFEAHDPTGTTLYGADISVHPDWRGRGLARSLYAARFELASALGLARFGTACRIPDWREWSVVKRDSLKQAYCLAVVRGEARDRTLTPLLRLGLAYRGVIEGYMDDEESGDAAALLEWTP